MMTLRRIFGLMLLFLFFEAVVAVVCTFAYPGVNVFLACVAMTGLALAVWAVFVLMTRWMMRPRVPPPPPAPRPAAAPAPRPAPTDDPITHELNSLIVEANRRLEVSLPRTKQGEIPSVTSLPLYLVVGGEGAGKTTTILKSGLELRLLAGEAERDDNVIPTRLCNLWFADGAIFADLSGRVFTQSADNWERALRVFSQPCRISRRDRFLRRPRRPSNFKGVLLVCDTNMLVRASDQQRTAAFARTLHERLRLTGAIFRRDFPVYLLFSKTDGVPYFKEFFAHLSEPEGRKLLGATLPYVRQQNDTADIYSDREGKRLTHYFNRLYMALAEMRLVFLARDEQVAKRSEAYEFPRELKKLRGDLVQFLLDIFRPDPLQPGPRLRGFYLSGQRWVTRAPDPVADSGIGYTVATKRSDATVFFGSKAEITSPGASMAPSPKTGAVPRWLFLSDLFHNIILKDRASDVAPQVTSQDQALTTFIFAGIGAVLLLLSILWANSWRHNRDLQHSMQRATEAVPAVQRQPESPSESIPQLEALREPLTVLIQYDRYGPPLSYRWGLYSGHDMLGPLAALYFARFRTTFMDPMLQSLTSRFMGLQRGAPASGEDVYSLLKTYRMMTSGECQPNAPFLGRSLPQVWASAVSLPAADDSALAEKQLQFYIQELMVRDPYQPGIRENLDAVTAAQAYLRDLHGSDRILGEMVEQINSEHQSDALSNYAPNYGVVLTGATSVEAAYTRDGWNAVMDNIRGHKLTSGEDACVVGKESGIAGINFTDGNEREVEQLYIRNYKRIWKEFLGSHHVEPFHGSADAAAKLRLLADNNRSPLLGLIYMTSHNTDLATAHSDQSAIEGITIVAKQKINSGLSNLLGKGSGNNTAQTPNQTVGALSAAQSVTHDFDPVHAVVDPSHPDKWLNSGNQAYMQSLEELGNALAGMPAKIDPKDPANQQAVTRANQAVQAATAAYHALGAIIPNSSSGVDVPLKALLLQPVTYSAKVIGSVPNVPPPPPPPDLTIPIRSQVNEAARTLCASIDGLRSKYPFNPSAQQEATVQDLNGVFAPQIGSLAQFDQSPDVSKVFLRQGKSWVPNPAFPGTPSQPFLESLNRLNALSEAFYVDGTPNPHFDYTVTLDGTGGVPAELDVDGHVVSYKPKKGPALARLVWPPTTNATTRLIVKAGQPLPVESSGQWSLFRLLQAADKQEGNVFVYSTIQFANGSKIPLQDGKGNPVTIQIRIDSPAASTFGHSYFGNLRCENFNGWAVR